jgi:hypothetical protein
MLTELLLGGELWSYIYEKASQLDHRNLLEQFSDSIIRQTGVAR